MPLKQFSDDLVRYKGPTRKSDDTVIDQAFLDAAGGTIVFRVYDNSKEHIIDRPITRVRADVAASGTVVTIPHIVPPIIEDGDTIEFFIDKGLAFGTYWFRTTATIVEGTDEDTEATNFDTLTLTGGASFDAFPKGTPVRVVTKAVGAAWLAVQSKKDPFGFGETIEAMRTSLLRDALVHQGQPYHTYASEDGQAAVDQNTFQMIQVVATAAALEEGVVLRVKLGGDVTMAEYGTSATWTDTDPASAGGGFEASIADSLVGVDVGRSILVEIEMQAGVGLKDVVQIHDVVVD